MANNYGVSRRTLLGVGGLMLGVGLVGCSDSEEGWESVTVDRITVSHPTEWVEKPPENENFTKNFTDGPHGMQIAGHYSDDTEPTLAWSVLEFMIRGTFQGYDPKGYQEITVKGAARAIKCPFDFTYKGKSARGYWLVASSVSTTTGSTGLRPARTHAYTAIPTTHSRTNPHDHHTVANARRDAHTCESTNAPRHPRSAAPSRVS